MSTDARPDPTFEAWVKQVFDHPADGPEWFWDSEADTSEPPPEVCIRFLTRLFNDPVKYAGHYEDAQLGQGLWFLVDNSCSSHMFAVFDTALPLDQRVACVRSIRSLFAKLFAARCSKQLSHRDPPNPNPLNLSCYMWWDLFPSWGTPAHDVDGELLAVMDSLLDLDSSACQESGLHGLSHWRAAYSEPATRSIARFLERGVVSDELRQYAQLAHRGCVD